MNGSIASRPKTLRRNTTSKEWTSAETTRIMLFWIATEMAPRIIKSAAWTIGGWLPKAVLSARTGRL